MARHRVYYHDFTEQMWMRNVYRGLLINTVVGTIKCRKWCKATKQYVGYTDIERSRFSRLVCVAGPVTTHVVQDVPLEDEDYIYERGVDRYVCGHTSSEIYDLGWSGHRDCKHELVEIYEGDRVRFGKEPTEYIVHVKEGCPWTERTWMYTCEPGTWTIVGTRLESEMVKVA